MPQRCSKRSTGEQKSPQTGRLAAFNGTRGKGAVSLAVSTRLVLRRRLFWQWGAGELELPGASPPSTTLPSPTGSHRWWCDTEDEDDDIAMAAGIEGARRGEREKASAPRLDGLAG